MVRLAHLQGGLPLFHSLGPWPSSSPHSGPEPIGSNAVARALSLPLLLPLPPAEPRLTLLFHLHVIALLPIRNKPCRRMPVLRCIRNDRYPTAEFTAFPFYSVLHAAFDTTSAQVPRVFGPFPWAGSWADFGPSAIKSAHAAGPFGPVSHGISRASHLAVGRLGRFSAI